MADPGFSWGALTPKVGVLTYIFCQKLHENEKIRTGGGGGWRPPMVPHSLIIHNKMINFLFKFPGLPNFEKCI